ncbi:hypothetical protein HJFPF1_04557 [Paramyrothecium foliicola]|nr:hypothetical protein HJFPF1_04557 [Paramyrothecium foliicola]
MVQTRAQKLAAERAIGGRDHVVETPRNQPRNKSPSKPKRRCVQAVEPKQAIKGNPKDPIDFWRKNGRWPRQYFEPDMAHILAQKRPPSGWRGRSNSASSTKESESGHAKSAAYRDSRYEAILRTKNVHLRQSKTGIVDDDKSLCRDLLTKEQTPPADSPFRDDLFMTTCDKIQGKNETKIALDIARLIAPSAEMLATYGAKHLEKLAESVGAAWTNSVALTPPRPQPDYSVGFVREAFTELQLAKLSPYIGDYIFGDFSYFMATQYVYFPFLTCEIKAGNGGLDTADRQNAHSATLAARGVVELFHKVGREHEVDRRILAFSISHDDLSVRIYGHYPVMCGQEITEYYRHTIHRFDFTALEGKEKWTAFRFVRNVYDLWMPDHFRNICSAIDQLPQEAELDQGAPTTSNAESEN